VSNSDREPLTSVGEKRSLPPEVEEELRRRARAAAALPTDGATAPTAAGPPEAEDAAAETHRDGWGRRIARFGPLGVFLLFLLGKLKVLAAIGKFVLPAFNALKLGSILTTGGTMLVSVVVYADRWGWWFALGFVLSILAHELGHVYVAWRKGLPVSAPIFIPGMGALILQKEAAKSAWDEALIGIGGPVAGTLAGLVCWLLYGLTGSGLMLGLAYTGFLINLFNLLPVTPLDGGWITGAVSPRLWAVGFAGILAMFLLGWIRNPLILILLLISLPRLWHGVRTGDVTPKGGTPATPGQRVRMGLAYVALSGFLAWLMAATHVTP